MQMERTSKHLLAIWAFLFTAIPSILGALEFIYMPRLEGLIKKTITEEIRRPENKEFIECLITVAGNKWQYSETSEDLTMFENVPDDLKNEFHRSEIRRLTDKKNMLLQITVNDWNKPCSDR